jgi:hypothetical protein
MAPLEEAKILRAQSITDKYKGNILKKDLARDKLNSPISNNQVVQGKNMTGSSQKKNK